MLNVEPERTAKLKTIEKVLILLKGKLIIKNILLLMILKFGSTIELTYALVVQIDQLFSRFLIGLNNSWLIRHFQ